MLKKIVAAALCAALISLSQLTFISVSADPTELINDTFSQVDGELADDHYPMGNRSLPLMVENGRLKLTRPAGDTSMPGFIRKVAGTNENITVTSGIVVSEFEFEFANSPVNFVSYAFGAQQNDAWQGFSQPQIDGVDKMRVGGQSIDTIVANKVYKQIIVADYDNFKSDYYLQNLTDGTAVSMTDLNRFNPNYSTPLLDSIYFLLQNKDASNPQTVYIDNLRVYRPSSFAVSAFKFSDNLAVAANQADVSVNSGFKLEFSSDVDPYTLSAITISPNVSDKVIAVDPVNKNVVNITFPTGLSGNTAYTISASTALKGGDYASLTSAWSASFTTAFDLKLRIEDFKFSNGTNVENNHANVMTDSRFRLYFNSDIDTQTLSGITISPAAAVQTVVDAFDGSIINMSFPSGLSYNTSYTISIDKDILKNTDGFGMTDNYSKSFTTASADYDPNLIFSDNYNGWTNGYVPSESTDGYRGGVNLPERKLSADNGRLKAESITRDLDFTRVFPFTVTSGMISVEYEFELDIIADKLYAFPALQTSEGVSYLQLQSTNGASINGLGCVIKANTRYKQTITADLTEKAGGNYYYSYTLENLSDPQEPIFERKDVSANTNFKNASVKDFKSIYFYIGRNGNGSQLPVTMYIDNFTVKKIPVLEFVGAQLPDGTPLPNGVTGIAPINGMQLLFNTELSPETVSGITISPAPEEYDVGVNPLNGKIINILFPLGLNYETSYSVTIPISLKSLMGSTLGAAATFSFTTENEPAVLVEVESVRFVDFDGNAVNAFPQGGKIAAEVSVKSLIVVPSVEKNIYVILAFKDSSGTLMDIAYLNTTVAYGERQTLTVGYTTGINTTGLRCDLYVWGDMPGTPYCAKNVFPN